MPDSKILYLGIRNVRVISTDKMTDEDFQVHALQILQRELGLDGLARLLRVQRSGLGDYTRRRHTWLKDANIDHIMVEVKSLTNS